jgi:enamine deaminase RidA (YjgF/YER057c/UK114 family)
VEIEAKLAELQIELGTPKTPVGNYVDCKLHGNLLYVSGRVSELTGAVGTDVTPEQARQAAWETVVLILSILKYNLGDLGKISGVLKMQGFIRSSENFTRQPYVLDGASELLIQLFGEEGRHARTATGVNQLPFGATIQLDLILILKS